MNLKIIITLLNCYQPIRIAAYSHNILSKYDQLKIIKFIRIRKAYISRIRKHCLEYINEWKLKTCFWKNLIEISLPEQYEAESLYSAERFCNLWFDKYS